VVSLNKRARAGMLRESLGGRGVRMTKATLQSNYLLYITDQGTKFLIKYPDRVGKLRIK